MSRGQRRLAAIMFTDMIGYTALGQKDETLSLAMVEEQRKLIRPVLSKHGGREVKTVGDAFLVEFQNAVDAVRCAYDIQRAIREFNFSLASDKRIHLRIGVHVGEVVESKGDISGDAVNVASRIESLAEDGGVFLTKQVYDHVQNKVDLQLSSIGQRSVKNVDAPLEIFRIEMPWNKEPAGKTERSDRKRIAVLPFANISPDPADEYFADGMTEELITSLSMVRELTVIARTSVAKYKDKSKGVSEIGRELKVGTLVEGSVRKAGDRVRIAVQLIDVENEAHIWAQNYDKRLDDIFGIQSEIGRSVAKELQIQLVESEKQRLVKKPTESTEAYTLYLKGRYQWHRRSKEGLEKALEYFRLARYSDPGFALALVGIADCYMILESNGYLDSAEASPKAMDAARQALELDNTLGEAHLSYAWALAKVWEWDKAIAEHERALELIPGSATAARWHGHLLFFIGRNSKGIAEFERAFQIDPQSPLTSLNFAEGSFIMGDYEKALDLFRKTLEIDRDYIPTFLSYIYALADRGFYSQAYEIQQRLAGSGFSAPRCQLFLAYIKAKQGKETEARSMLTQVKKESTTSIVPTEEIAAVHAALRDKDEAFRLLYQATVKGNQGFIALKYVPRFNPLQADPRYGELLRKMGLQKFRRT